ncbi:hypothetical protein [Paenibacillus sp. FSL L8-0708]|uniref:hypothetical protein n=1 Tax=Paenibacillus sp. FSL L8-0708 TaxID=2975311 RepID=UPI0030FB54D6
MAVAEWEMVELFPLASETEIARTKTLLEDYRKMRLLMDDYENNTEDMQQVAIDGEVARRIDQDELHADKAANAVLLAEKQRWVYEQYLYRHNALLRAHSLIIDDETKQVIDYRFLQGYTMKETCLFFKRGVGDSTIKRKAKEGVISMANSLKTLCFFDNDVTKF